MNLFTTSCVLAAVGLVLFYLGKTRNRSDIQLGGSFFFAPLAAWVVIKITLLLFGLLTVIWKVVTFIAVLITLGVLAVAIVFAVRAARYYRRLKGGRT